MCAHSSSGEEITEKIGQKLYPYLSKVFQEVLDYTSVSPLSEEHQGIMECFYLLKSEFDSLKNYELKLVFPAVLSVFNTKDNQQAKPSINIAEIQALTQKKEKMIDEYVRQLGKDITALKLAESHPLFSLLCEFQTSFIQEKQQWNTMLNGWSIGCACFLAAQQPNEIAHHQ
jgi:hypothetical protein